MRRGSLGTLAALALVLTLPSADAQSWRDDDDGAFFGMPVTSKAFRIQTDGPTPPFDPNAPTGVGPNVLDVSRITTLEQAAAERTRIEGELAAVATRAQELADRERTTTEGFAKDQETRRATLTTNRDQALAELQTYEAEQVKLLEENGRQRDASIQRFETDIQTFVTTETQRIQSQAQQSRTAIQQAVAAGQITQDVASQQLQALDQQMQTALRQVEETARSRRDEVQRQIATERTGMEEARKKLTEDITKRRADIEKTFTDGIAALDKEKTEREAATKAEFDKERAAIDFEKQRLEGDLQRLTAREAELRGGDGAPSTDSATASTTPTGTGSPNDPASASTPRGGSPAAPTAGTPPNPQAQAEAELNAELAKNGGNPWGLIPILPMGQIQSRLQAACQSEAPAGFSCNEHGQLIGGNVKARGKPDVSLWSPGAISKVQAELTKLREERLAALVAKYTAAAKPASTGSGTATAAQRGSPASVAAARQ